MDSNFNQTRSVKIDIEKGDDDAVKESVAVDPALPVIVQHGRWIPTRNGTLITLPQWRVLEGHFKFHCNGRLMRGPGNPYWWFILIFHLIAATLSCLWFEILPTMSLTSIVSVSLLLATILPTCLTIVSICHVSFSDPGCIIRADVNERVCNLVLYFADKCPNSEVTKVMHLNGKEVIYSFCKICCHFRPPRVEHCLVCDACIEQFDHHNSTFGICIGRRNIGAFIRYLFLSLLHFQVIQTVAVASIIDNVKKNGWVLHSFLSSPTLYVLLLSSFHPPFGPLTMAWTLLRQLYNFMLDRTTYESLQVSNKGPLNNERKVSSGWKNNLSTFWNNFKTLVMWPAPKSQLKPRSWVKIRATQAPPVKWVKKTNTAQPL